MEFFSTLKTLGILGGGQLGKMLLYTTRKWDIKTSVLDPSENAPATLACDHFTKGDLTDFQAVYDFGKKVDVLTIEIEKVNVKALEKLEQEGVKVYPQPHVLKTIQNKCLQKNFTRVTTFLRLPLKNSKPSIKSKKPSSRGICLSRLFVNRPRWVMMVMGYLLFIPTRKSKV